ncbi:MAG: SRPBCC domain-containing protein [Calditrichia bacterium]
MMNKNLTVSKTVEINAGQEVVWDALTNPAKIKEYFFGTETTSAWKQGSEIIFKGKYQGKSYRDKGIIREIKPGSFLQYNYWSHFSGLEDKAENYSLVTYRLRQESGKTILTVTQTGFAKEDGFRHAETGWEQVLQKIKEIAEKK